MINVLKASAGAGKTYNLVLEYIKALMRAEVGFLTTEKGWSANPHRHILAITFTNNSTNEMKARILQDLKRLADGEHRDYERAICDALALKGSNDDVIIGRIRKAAGRLLEDLLNDYSMMRVSTIDSFFNQIIRSFSRDLGLDQTPVAESDDIRIREKAVDTMLAELDNERNKELLQFIKDFTHSQITEGKKWKIRDSLVQFSEIILSEDYITNFDNDTTTLTQIADYRKRLKEYVKSQQAEADKALDEMSAIAQDYSEAMDLHAKNAIINRNMGAALWKKEVETAKFFKSKKGDAATDLRLRELFDKVKQAIFTEEFKTKRLILESIHITGLLGELRRVTETICRDNDCILLSTANHLITKIIDGCDTPFIYERVGVTTNHYMIDEFQDTSHIQWENFKPLIAEANAQSNDSLIVGDIKQSIYRWRNGDWRILHQGIASEFGNSMKVTDLKFNYRSSHEIVKFNNMLYTKLPELMDEAMGTSCFKDIYDNGVQLMPESTKDKPGQVETHFISPKAKSGEFMEYALRLIVNDIRKHDRKYWGETAVIVRNNAEAGKVAAAMAKAGVAFCSSESFLLKADTTVQLVIAYLRHVIAPEESLYSHCLEHLLNGSGLGRISDKPGMRPLQEIPAAIVEELGIMPISWGYSLTDTIKRYVMNNEASIPRFLEWWEAHEDKLCIPMPKIKETVTIMTIHKSKGLEFKNVYLLMAKEPWRCGINAKHTNYKSVENDELPHIILNINDSEMADTIYAPIREAETIDCCIDTLNTLYVATTRAVERLIIVAHPADSKTSMHTNDLLMKAVGGVIEEIEEQEETEGTESQEVQEKREETKAQPASRAALPVRLSHESPEQRHGTICHNFLSLINKEGDEQEAIEKMMADGTITESNINELMKVYNTLKVKGIFSPENKAMNERSIAINGEIYRPDRIIFKPDGKVLIVDYKFGEKRKSHQEQIERYANLMGRMGYTVETELLYLIDN